MANFPPRPAKFMEIATASSNRLRMMRRVVSATDFPPIDPRYRTWTNNVLNNCCKEHDWIYQLGLICFPLTTTISRNCNLWFRQQQILFNVFKMRCANWAAIYNRYHAIYFNYLKIYLYQINYYALFVLILKMFSCHFPS